MSHREIITFMGSVVCAIAISKSDAIFPIWSLWAFTILGSFIFLYLYFTGRNQ